MREEKKFSVIVGSLLLLAALAVPLRADKITDRVATSTIVYRELIKVPDDGAPDYLRRNCKAVVIVPHVVKAALGVGGRHGRGVALARGADGSFSPPSFVSLSGGSFGFQIGASATDLVLFVMTERGMKSLLESKVTLGADATVAAGPVGRSAEAGTDIQFKSDIYAYARSKGAFAGIALDGSVLTTDDDALERFYGREVTAKQILFERKAPKLPAAARTLMQALP